jgi:hypothetical protein
MTKLKGKFLLKDYQLSLFRKMHNLKQKQLIVKEYSEEIVGPSRCTERGGGVNQYWTILSLTYFNLIKHQQVIKQLYTCTQRFYVETQFGKNHKCFSYIV